MRSLRLLGIGALLLAALTAAAHSGDAPAKPAGGSGKTDWAKDVLILLTGPTGQSQLAKSPGIKGILDDLQPDFTEWSVIPAIRDPEVRAHRFFPREIPGGYEYQEYSSKWGFWEKDLNTPWAVDEEHGVAMSVHGKPVPHLAWGGEKSPTRWYVCHNSPAWHAFQMASVVKHAANPEVRCIRQDNIGMPVGVTSNGCYCRWCKEKLRARVKALSQQPGAPGSLSGAGDPDQFDIAAYVREKGYLGKIERALDDPLVIAWMDTLFGTNLDAWRDIGDAVHAARPDVAVCGNQGVANWNAYSSVVLSQANDAIFLEQWRRPDYAKGQRLTLGYKVQCAAGRHDKPVWVWGFPMKENLENAAEAELFLAEAFANFTMPYFQLYNLFWSNETGTIGIEPTPEVYAVMKQVARFAREHQEMLTRVHRSEARVALVYSVPSWLYTQCSAMDFWSGNPLAQAQRRHLEAWARALEALHVPYDVVVWGGNAEFWRDDGTEATLARTHTLVLPNTVALSNAQAEWVKAFALRGGSVLLSGEVGVRDEHYRRRPTGALAAMPARARGRVTHAPADAFEVPEESAARLAGVLRAALKGKEPIIHTDAPPSLFLNPARRGRTLLLHCVNYAHASAGDVKDVRVSLRLPDDLAGRKGAAALRGFVAAPGEPAQPLAIKREGNRVTFTLPHVRVWVLAWLQPAR